MGLNMLCVLSGGNWNNSSNAGVWSRNLSNSRANSNNNSGCVPDSLPCLAVPNVAMAIRQRGSHLRGLCRNVQPQRLLVAHAKTGAGHLFHWVAP